MDTIVDKLQQQDAGLNPKNINGWGIDADPQNDPTYPMRDRSKEEEKGYTWARPQQQPESVEILQSNERPFVSSVFGTASPPRGLSGMIRRMAFNYSEGSWGHWIPLLLADRVDEVEGIVEDLAHGHVPNFVAEHGWNAEWKHNRKSAVTTIVVGAAVVTAAAGVAYMLLRDNKKKKLI